VDFRFHYPRTRARYNVEPRKKNPRDVSVTKIRKRIAHTDELVIIVPQGTEDFLAREHSLAELPSVNPEWIAAISLDETQGCCSGLSLESQNQTKSDCQPLMCAHPERVAPPMMNQNVCDQRWRGCRAYSDSSENQSVGQRRVRAWESTVPRMTLARIHHRFSSAKREACQKQNCKSPPRDPAEPRRSPR
jgi:hypothetical protein